MHQTGHGLVEKTMSWDRISKDDQRTPVKPVLDGEPLYEDHPLAFRAKEFGYSFDAHIRQRAYWSVFAGSCGHTYGNHSVWQMYARGRKPINGPPLYWYVGRIRERLDSCAGCCIEELRGAKRHAEGQSLTAWLVGGLGRAHPV